MLPSNVRELLEIKVRLSPDKPFLFGQEDGSHFTYQQFDNAVNRTANLLLSLGAGRGERVSLFLTNRVEYLICYFACFKIGAWAGPVNAFLKPPEIEFVVSDSEASIVSNSSRFVRTP